MRFSRQKYRTGLPCPPPGDLPDPRIEPASLTSPVLVSLPLASPRKPNWLVHTSKCHSGRSRFQPLGINFIWNMWQTAVSLKHNFCGKVEGFCKTCISKNSVQFSRSVMSNSLRTHGLQHARLPYPSPNPGAHSNSCLLSQWCRIQPSHPLLSPSPPAFNLSQHQRLFKWVSSLHQVVTVLEFQLLASVLPMNMQDWFPLGNPCSSRDSQESSPIPQFKSVNSLALSFL